MLSRIAQRQGFAVLFNQFESFHFDFKAVCATSCFRKALKLDARTQTSIKRASAALDSLEPVQRKRVKYQEDLDGAHVAVDALSKLLKKACINHQFCC